MFCLSSRSASLYKSHRSYLIYRNFTMKPRLSPDTFVSYIQQHAELPCKSMSVLHKILKV